nr:MAG TPA: Protein recA [Caudoviricetes sp.]
MRNIDLKMAELNKKFKAQIINQGTDIIDVSKIPFSSPTANYMTYGGVPVGKITEFYGGEGGGKTTSALDICANAQKCFNKAFSDKMGSLTTQLNELEAKDTKEAKKLADKVRAEVNELQEKGPKVVVYVDAEQTLDVEWAKLLGVDTESMILVRPQEQTAEQVLQIIIDLVSTGDVGLCVLDSIPMLVSQNILEESLEKKSYGGISQALTTFCSKITPHLVQNQCAFIGINQIREDLSSMYNTTSTPGGKMWKHACSLRLRFRKDTLLDINNGELTSRAENPAGNRVGIEITKTKVCKPDRRIGYYTLNYTGGIDVLADTLTIGIQLMLIKRGGSWYYYTDKNGNEYKFQGSAKLLEELRTNEPFKTELQNRINEVMYNV